MSYATAVSTFWVADFNGCGDLQLGQAYTYALLERVPGAAELIGDLASHLWRSPEQFEAPLRPSPESGPTLRWLASAPTAGIATIRADDAVVSLSLLATGLDAEADRLTLRAFHRHLLQELHGTPHEPSFALLEQHHRPLLATFNLIPPREGADRALVALADRCFAAAYFRYAGLA